MISLDQNLINKFLDIGLNFAVITGRYDIEGTQIENKDFVSDLDIVFFDITAKNLFKVLLELGLEQVNKNSFVYENNEEYLPVDIYIDQINCGYYFLFKIEKENIQEVDSLLKISEDDYILYQFIEPLIKFSEYKPRHKHRLKKYYENGFVNKNILSRLTYLVGNKNLEIILNHLFEDFSFPNNFVKKIKFRLLFKNKNILRVIKKRILKNEQLLY